MAEVERGEMCMRETGPELLPYLTNSFEKGIHPFTRACLCDLNPSHTPVLKDSDVNA
jgi:hypothetical protein